jgi:hypothetical protein
MPEKGRLARTIDANEPSAHRRLSSDSAVNRLGKRGIVMIECADDDTRLIWLEPIETDEMFAVEGDKHVTLGSGKRQHRIVRERLSCAAALHLLLA